MLPYLAFLAMVEVSQRVPATAAAWLLALKPAVPAVLMIWFALRGTYPELRRGVSRGLAASGWLLDVAVGVVSALLWMAPYVLSPALRIWTGADAQPGFDPGAFPPLSDNAALALRALGYVVVTPLFEELFIRSFVLRLAEAWPQGRDFRALPIGRFGLRAFAVTVVVFTLGHAPWEWPVAVAWVALTNLWLLYRRSLWALIVTHAAANGSILLAALLWRGEPPLWFFV